MCAQPRQVEATSRDCHSQLFGHADTSGFGVPASFGDAGPFRNFFSQMEHSAHPPHGGRQPRSGNERYFRQSVGLGDDEMSLPGPSYRYDDRLRPTASAGPRNPIFRRYEDDTDSDDNY